VGRIQKERGGWPRAGAVGPGRVLGGEGDHLLQAGVQLQLLRPGADASVGVSVSRVGVSVSFFFLLVFLSSTAFTARMQGPTTP